MSDALETRADTARPGSPAGFWAIWLIALMIVLGLVAAVVRYLSLPQSTAADTSHGGEPMAGMESAPTAALTRLRPDTPVRGLLGHSLLTQWQLNAVAVGFVVLLAAWYLTCVVKARRQGPWPWSRTAAFMAGLAFVIVATCGSIGVYDMALFSAHMLGHLCFVMVAPALLMAGRPLELSLLASSASMRRRLERVYLGRVVSLLTAPPVALASYAVVIVGSHLTGLMDTIMSNSWAGQAEHLIYLVVGCQFFVLVLGDAPIRWQLSTPARWLLLALAMAVDTFVGIVIMQTNQPFHMEPLAGLSVNPLSDTHTGGSIMWFGGDAIMAAVMIALVIGWLRDPERQRQDNASWLEQARRETYAERVLPHESDGEEAATAAVMADLDFDNDETRLDAYNNWLQNLHRSSSPEERPIR
jgi:cytochrome c oxidase assembly factor CtaG